MSALKDPNRNELVEHITETANEIYGIKSHKLRYHNSEHTKRTEWLKQHANIANLYNYE